MGRPVPLHKRSSSHFRPTVRERGKQNLEAGRVALEIEAMRSRSRVEGADKNTYAVGLDWSQVEGKRALHAFCECRRFAAGKPCEHIWATLLALGANGQDVQPPGRDRVSLRKDHASAWDDLGVSPEALAIAVAVEEAPPRRHSPPRTHSAGAARHPSTSWRSQLDSLRAEVGRLSTAVAASPAIADAAVSTRFLVNTAASRSNDGLVLDVFTRRIGSGGKPGKLKRTGIEPDESERTSVAQGRAARSHGRVGGHHRPGHGGQGPAEPRSTRQAEEQSDPEVSAAAAAA